MDEFKEFLYIRRPHYRNLEVGNLTKQTELRKHLGCKSFKWYIETVAFDQPLKYPPIEPPDFAKGEVGHNNIYFNIIFYFMVNIIALP